ncbi:BTB/POZ and MATH domain-containing protein 2 [Dichanthelium oligosanthes]|uniref:BTB/POZ and MATH domain-containing protein 2 n=1 Tax=Dichanthelium oligosanthes TaxID=888268 RepID=A0A1E5W3Y8_9POAL|nr:BTB/POZ and MATH domain-containing protein 2 [Dichanthelium oligosanthes]
MQGSSTSPAAGDGPPSRSASAIVAGAVTGYHVLKIVGYSRTKEIPTGQRIDSSPFRVGGRTWFVEYHPNGSDAENADFISLFLALNGTVTEAVKAQVTVSLLDQDGKPVPLYRKTTGFINFSEEGSWGYPDFIGRQALEKSEHLRDDCFTVRFDVTVLKDAQTVETPFLVVPPSDMHQHFGDLLSSKEGVDVKFRVGGKTFSAHRLVLSARSPVFKAELYGPMRESTTSNVIRINDMEAEVFDALLTFMYTDTLPEMKGQEESAMAQHLLVAADRYNLERLKLICEDTLCKHIDTDSAATILALAEQHNCHGLKDACFAFLSSSSTLEAVMETDGFEYLTSSCPRVLKELVSKVVPR